jgi:hypothetical protein
VEGILVPAAIPSNDHAPNTELVTAWALIPYPTAKAAIAIHRLFFMIPSSLSLSLNHQSVKAIAQKTLFPLCPN